MANVGHFDARVLASDIVDQDAIIEAVTGLIEPIDTRLKSTEQAVSTIGSDYVTSKNIGEKFRSSVPKFWDKNPVDYNNLDFNDHLLWDYATGATHAPPVPEPQWMFVEMIKTFEYPASNPIPHNAVQRAWGYKLGFMATRSRYQGKWSKWSVSTMTEDARPQTMPEQPPQDINTP